MIRSIVHHIRQEITDILEELKYCFSINQQHQPTREDDMRNEHGMVVEGRFADVETGRYHVVVVREVPRQGQSELYPERVKMDTSWEDACRHTHSLLRCMGEPGKVTSGFRYLADVYIEEPSNPTFDAMESRQRFLIGMAHEIDDRRKYEAEVRFKAMIRHFESGNTDRAILMACGDIRDFTFGDAYLAAKEDPAIDKKTLDVMRAGAFSGLAGA